MMNNGHTCPKSKRFEPKWDQGGAKKVSSSWNFAVDPDLMGSSSTKQSVRRWLLEGTSQTFAVSPILKERKTDTRSLVKGRGRHLGSVERNGKKIPETWIHGIQHNQVDIPNTTKQLVSTLPAVRPVVMPDPLKVSTPKMNSQISRAYEVPMPRPET